jgi:hypothetical protein
MPDKPQAIDIGPAGGGWYGWFDLAMKWAADVENDLVAAALLSVLTEDNKC